MLREKWLAAAIGVLMASFAQTGASAADVFCFALPPKTQPVNGVPVTVTTRVYRSDGMPCFQTPLNFKGVANLSGLQSKISQIVARIPLPQDNCAGYGLNVVLSLSDPRLFAPGSWPHDSRGGYYGYLGQLGVALFQTDGKAVIWDCAKNPVPKITVVWETRSYRLFGRTHYYRVPVTQISERPPIKTILATQPFTYYQALTLRRASADSVEIVQGMNDIVLTGKYVEITRLVLGNFMDQFTLSLNAAATFSVPGFKIDDARFVGLSPPNGQSGELGAELLLSR
jgi:hypothetical protein